MIAQRRADLRAAIAAALGRHRRIVWEIGCGHGHFLVRYASEHPGKYCVGVDLRLERLERSTRKRDRSRLPNCHFLRAEAREFLHTLPAEVTFEEVWVLFPDPWPKARHHKNRLLKPEFFEAIAARCPAGARFFFRTDHQDYFREVQGFVPQLRTWRLAPDAPWPLEQETVFQARAPRHYSLVAVRTEDPAKPTTPIAPGLPPLEAPR